MILDCKNTEVWCMTRISRWQLVLLMIIGQHYIRCSNMPVTNYRYNQPLKYMLLTGLFNKSTWTTFPPTAYIHEDALLPPFLIWGSVKNEKGLFQYWIFQEIHHGFLKVSYQSAFSPHDTSMTKLAAGKNSCQMNIGSF